MHAGSNFFKASLVLSTKMNNEEFGLTHRINLSPSYRKGFILGSYFLLLFTFKNIIPSQYLRWLELIITIMLIPYILRQGRLYIRLEMTLIFFYMIWLFVSARIHMTQFDDLLSVYAYCTLLFVVLSLTWSVKEVRVIQLMALLGVISFVLILFLSNGLESIGAVSRSRVPYGEALINANGIPVYVYLGLICASDLYLNKKMGTFVWTFLLVMFLYALFLSASRSGFVGLLIILAYVARGKIKTAIPRKRAFIVIGIVTAVFLLIEISSSILPEYIFKRLFIFANYSDNGRSELVQLALNYAKGNWLVGRGSAFWRLNTGNSYGSHNLYVDTLLAYGIPGVLLIVSIVALFVKKSLKYRNSFAITAMVLLLIHTLLESGREIGFWGILIIVYTTISSLRKRLIYGKN